MEEYRELLDKFIEQTVAIFGGKLVGIYLHGSAVMGCFNARKSDIDLLVVVGEDISDAEKRAFMDRVVELNELAPEKGIELSVMRREVCKPFVYPTPYELHFSMTHLDWYRRDPEDYVARMKGVDKDLAAHCTILYHRGKTLRGEAIKNVFGEVPGEAYLDSIWYDIENAVEDVAENPVYIILNLCRVLAYKKEGLILSKKEGGEWGLQAPFTARFADLISGALREYGSEESLKTDGAMRGGESVRMDEPAQADEAAQTEKSMRTGGTVQKHKPIQENVSACDDKSRAREFAAYMLEQIRGEQVTKE